MKSIKVFLAIVLTFSMSIVHASASSPSPKKELYGLEILSETFETTILEDGTRVETVTRELDGDIEDLKRILNDQELIEQKGRTIIYDKFNTLNVSPDDKFNTLNVSPAAIPNLKEVECFDGDSIMIQCVGTTNGLDHFLSNADTKYTVKGNLTTYQVAYPGNTVSNLVTQGHLKTVVWGVTGSNSIIISEKSHYGPKGTSSSSFNVDVSVTALVVNAYYYAGGEFEFKSGGQVYGNTHWTSL